MKTNRSVTPSANHVTKPNVKPACNPIADPVMDPETEQAPPFWHRFGPGLLLIFLTMGTPSLIALDYAYELPTLLLLLVFLFAYLIKYPFFRFGFDYPHLSGESLIEGYFKTSKLIFYGYFLLCFLNAIIKIATLAYLCAITLNFLLPPNLRLLEIPLAAIILGISWLTLLLSRYKFLNSMNKGLLISLSLTFLSALGLFLFLPIQETLPPSPHSANNFDNPAFSPHQIFTFIGLMPFAMELSPIASLWTLSKIKKHHTKLRHTRTDFHLGYILSAAFFLILLLFSAWGLNTGGIERTTELYMDGMAQKLINTPIAWPLRLVATGMVLALFGNIITCIDGYNRSHAECWRLIKEQPKTDNKHIILWTSVSLLTSLAILFLVPNHSINILLLLSAILSTAAAPVLAWLNNHLIKNQQPQTTFLNRLSLFSLTIMSMTALMAVGVFLVSFAALFLWYVLPLLFLTVKNIFSIY